MRKIKPTKSSENMQKSNKKKMNPFEIHVNKEKFKILGKKLKNDRGIPGISREKALNKRKNTLQVEYRLQNKANKFVDKRIGEGNINMTDENRLTARYATLKAKKHKKSIFNLADEEILTHKGQTLSEIEKFENTNSDEDSLDETDTGKLDSNFVKEAHFGGGFLKKINDDGAKSHKDLINQLIAESKKRKAEKQKLKEETLELTEKLDVEWKDLLPLVNKVNSMETTTTNEKSDEYDKVMRQLKFEARGTPSDRLKTEDELAKEEMAKLEKLEEERLQRMHGFSKVSNVCKQHVSADDLDDNFIYDSDPDITLSYNTEGLANTTVKAELNGKVINSKQNINENLDKASDTDDNSDDEDSSEEIESDDNLSDLKETISSESESETEETEVNKFDAVNVSSSATNKTNAINITIRDNLLMQKDVMEKAKNELPYTYKLPTNYEDLQSLLQNESERQHIIIERMIKCNHPSLDESNKEKLNMLFAYVLQYINDLSYAAVDNNSINNCFHTYSCLVPHVFDLAHMNTENAHKSVLEVINEKQLEYRKRKDCYPGVDTLLFLKLVSCLFPTSDFKHMVITPSIVFIDQMLNNCKVRSRRDISTGLFLTTLLLEYTTLSQRYLPSAINFLAGVLHMCIPKTGIKLYKISPPFKSLSNKLVLFNNCEDADLKEKMDFVYLLNGEIGDEYKITVFYIVICLLEEFLQNFKCLYSAYEIFLPIENYLNLISLNNYPSKVREKSKLLINNLKDLKITRTLTYLVVNKQRPKALRLYDPNIEKIFDTKKHKVQSKEKAERDKLLYKLKQEQKGALREIRRDRAFIARLKIDEQMQSDKERRDKVRKLLAEASIQQSELNDMDRKKKRKK